MAHDHSHGDRNAYYLDQLFTIAVCGALGGVAIMLWYNGKLSLMLAPKFFLWVLLGGITLLVLVLYPGCLAVWRSVDEAATGRNPHTRSRALRTRPRPLRSRSRTRSRLSDRDGGDWT